MQHSVAQAYQLELLKDRIEELEDELSQLKRTHRETCREYDKLKRESVTLKEELDLLKAELAKRDRLIDEKGLVIIDEDISKEDKNNADTTATKNTAKKPLVSIENVELQKNVGETNVNIRLKRFAEEKRDLMDQLSHLRKELEEERNNIKLRANSRFEYIDLETTANSESDSVDVMLIQREANKQLDNYKFRLRKSEQDIRTFKATVARLENQVNRYKSAVEASENAEIALKSEKRKLQRDARESQSRIEDLETANTYLQRRLDKLKTAKSELLKKLS